MWIKTESALSDGWYWWRLNPDWPKFEYKVFEVINGIIVDSEPIDSYGMEWRVVEHNDFDVGEWWGPINKPD